MVLRVYDDGSFATHWWNTQRGINNDHNKMSITREEVDQEVTDCCGASKKEGYTKQGVVDLGE